MHGVHLCQLSIAPCSQQQQLISFVDQIIPPAFSEYARVLTKLAILPSATMAHAVSPGPALTSSPVLLLYTTIPYSPAMVGIALLANVDYPMSPLSLSFLRELHTHRAHFRCMLSGRKSEISL